MDWVRARVMIGGRVQGVNFRACTRDEARAFGVDGWVRNLEDGRVEAVFEGPKLAVKRIISWCYGGPSHASVERVEVQWEHPTGQERDFSIVW